MVCYAVTARIDQLASPTTPQTRFLLQRFFFQAHRACHRWGAPHISSFQSCWHSGGYPASVLDALITVISHFLEHGCDCRRWEGKRHSQQGILPIPAQRVNRSWHFADDLGVKFSFWGGLQLSVIYISENPTMVGLVKNHPPTPWSEQMSRERRFRGFTYAGCT